VARISIRRSAPRSKRSSPTITGTCSLPRHQKWFIAELLRQACGIDQPHALDLASVTARQHIELDSTRLEQTRLKEVRTESFPIRLRKDCPR